MDSQQAHSDRRAKLTQVMRDCDINYSDLARELSKAGLGNVAASEIYYLLFRNTVLAAPFRNLLLDLGIPDDALPPEASATN